MNVRCCERSPADGDASRGASRGERADRGGAAASTPPSTSVNVTRRGVSGDGAGSSAVKARDAGAAADDDEASPSARRSIPCSAAATAAGASAAFVAASCRAAARSSRESGVCEPPGVGGRDEGVRIFAGCGSREDERLARAAASTPE